MATIAKQMKMVATPTMSMTTRKTVFCCSCSTGIGEGLWFAEKVRTLRAWAGNKGSAVDFAIWLGISKRAG